MRGFILSLACGAASAAEGGPDIERLQLRSDGMVLELTPALGGRVLAFGLPGQASVIKLGQAMRDTPVPAVAADAGDVGYLGHDVWLGPQSGWWSDQDVNPTRRAARANWPPDPYLAFSTLQLLEHDPDHIVLEGGDSPVTGVRLRKSFLREPGDESTVQLSVQARNIRDRPVVRDLWFNTRTVASARVYVPVATGADVRVEGTDGFLAPAWTISVGVFTLERQAPAAANGVRGKLFLQPAAGWMAAFQSGQAFIIRFPLQPREAIHPSHGQVELYLDHAADPAAGLLELEVHAPLRTLAPGTTMQAIERWSVLAYDGADSAQVQREFLCTVAAPRLHAPELCVAATDPVDQGTAAGAAMPSPVAAQ